MTELLADGSLLGAYRLVRRLGSGGMGEVWLAEHAMLGRRAAIKVLHDSFSRRPEIVTRFFNEARAAAAISDPGIVQIFDFGRHGDGTAFIVMEMLEGESLGQRVRRHGSLPLLDALRLVRQIASSLAAAHARGIVHRDLKPDNVFIVSDPEVIGGERIKILDFGVAKLLGNQSGDQTTTSVVLGTPSFMAPEQCRGAGQVDHRADLYSLGCILFAILAGRPPFCADGPGELISMHLREPPPRLSSIVIGLPAEIDELVARCLVKDPAARFGSASALIAAIGAAQEHLPAAVPTRPRAPTAYPDRPATTLTEASSEVAGRRPLSSRTVIWGTTALVLVGVIIGAAATLGDGGSPGISSRPEPPPTESAGPPPAPPAQPRPAAPPQPPPPQQRAAPAEPPATVPDNLAATPAAGGAHSAAGQAGEPAAAPCSEQAFAPVLQARDASHSVVEDAIVKLRTCEAAMPKKQYADIQRRLVARLLD